MCWHLSHGVGLAAGTLPAFGHAVRVHAIATWHRHKEHVMRAFAMFLFSLLSLTNMQSMTTVLPPVNINLIHES